MQTIIDTETLNQLKNQVALCDKAKIAESLLSLLRSHRGRAESELSVLQALAIDLKLKNGSEEFNPLAPNDKNWKGDKPTMLTTLSPEPWQTEVDTCKRLERLALVLIKRWVINSNVKISNDLIRRLPKTAVVLAWSKSFLNA